MVLIRSAALRRPLAQRFSQTLQSGIRGAERHPWQRAIARRGYADSHGGSQKAGSDLPWAIGAVIVTIPSCFYILSSGSSGDHGHEGHGEHAEEKEEKEEEEDKEDKEDASDEAKDREEAGEKPEDDDPKEQSDSEQKKEQKKDKKKAKDEGADGEDGDNGDKDDKDDGDDGDEGDDGTQTTEEAAKDGFKGPGKGVKDDTRKKEPSSKSDSGEKKRIDSAKRTPQGAAGDEDKLSNNKTQKGLSNAPTMHSTDQMKNPESSKKGEGAPDTAKVSSPVDPQRPAT